MNLADWHFFVEEIVFFLSQIVFFLSQGHFNQSIKYYTRFILSV